MNVNSTNYDFVPTILFKNKKDRIYSFGYGVLNKSINVGMYYKLSFKN